jgi:hypothetical protein
MADLPAVDLIGYALNLAEITPFDIVAVCIPPCFSHVVAEDGLQG